MNELYQGRLGVGVPTTGLPLPPIQIQPPSMGSVLDMLNVINGILFVQISQQDIEAFREEIERRQLSEGISPSKAIESKNGQVDDESNSQVGTCS